MLFHYLLIYPSVTESRFSLLCMEVDKDVIMIETSCNIYKPKEQIVTGSLQFSGKLSTIRHQRGDVCSYGGSDDKSEMVYKGNLSDIKQHGAKFLAWWLKAVKS